MCRPKIAVLFLVGACTTLGPMPATTGVSAVPVDRPGLELQAGPVPGVFLSQTTRNTSGSPITQIAALAELDRVIRLPGLIFGARVFGESGDTLLEPYVGYRHRLGARFAIAGGAYGTAKRSQDRLASYHGTRIGGEGAIDAKLFEPASWFAIHGQASIAVTRVFASGTYCVDADGLGQDCSTDNPSTNTMVSGDQRGYYPTAVGTLAFDFARDINRRFGGVQLALMFGGGAMPVIRNGAKVDTSTYATIGATLTVTLGLADKDSDSLAE